MVIFFVSPTTNHKGIMSEYEFRHEAEGEFETSIVVTVRLGEDGRARYRSESKGLMEMETEWEAAVEEPAEGSGGQGNTDQHVLVVRPDKEAVERLELREEMQWALSKDRQVLHDHAGHALDKKK